MAPMPWDAALYRDFGRFAFAYVPPKDKALVEAKLRDLGHSVTWNAIRYVLSPGYYLHPRDSCKPQPVIILPLACLHCQQLIASVTSSRYTFNKGLITPLPCTMKYEPPPSPTTATMDINNILTTTLTLSLRHQIGLIIRCHVMQFQMDSLAKSTDPQWTMLRSSSLPEPSCTTPSPLPPFPLTPVQRRLTSLRNRVPLHCSSSVAANSFLRW